MATKKWCSATLDTRGRQTPGERGQGGHLAHRDEAQRAQGHEEESAGPRQGKLEKAKASVRAKVEHPFHVLKNLFRHRKTRYRGLAKNTAQLHTLFAFANLVLAGRTFGSAQARTPS